jgi:hypothetical protein
MGVSFPSAARLVPAALLGGWLLAGPAGCYPPAGPGNPNETVSLRLRGTPPDAAVIIDEEAVGQLDFIAAHGVALPPGVHHVTVKATGYFPWDREVKAEPGDRPIELDVKLTPVPD